MFLSKHFTILMVYFAIFVLYLNICVDADLESSRQGDNNRISFNNLKLNDNLVVESHVNEDVDSKNAKKTTSPPSRTSTDYFKQAYQLYKYYKLYKNQPLYFVEWSNVPLNLRSKLKFYLQLMKENGNSDAIGNALYIAENSFTNLNKNLHLTSSSKRLPFTTSPSITFLDDKLFSSTLPSVITLKKFSLQNQLQKQIDNLNDHKSTTKSFMEKSITYPTNVPPKHLNLSKNLIHSNQIPNLNIYQNKQNSKPSLPFHNSFTSNLLSSLTDLQMAFENVKDIENNHRCKIPKARLFSLRELNSNYRFYLPKCVYLHKCDGQTGCCTGQNEQCVATEQEVVFKHFYHLSGNQNQNRVVKLSFVNDTHCGCRESNKQNIIDYDLSSSKIKLNQTLNEKTNLEKKGYLNELYFNWYKLFNFKHKNLFICNKKSKICPSPYSIQKNSSYDNICSCGCLKDNFNCFRVMTGLHKLDDDVLRCVLRNDCYEPECLFRNDKYDYDRTTGYCPKRKI